MNYNFNIGLIVSIKFHAIALEALAQQQYAKKSNSNPYWNPGKYQQTHSVEKGAREYREEEARRKYNEEYEAQLRKDKEKENQDFIKKIASVQNDEKAFTPADLYEAGLIARKNGDGVEATMRLWQALICGDKRAAYPLFEMLRDGEGGIPKNMEMAGLFFYVANQCDDERCQNTPIPLNIPFDAAKAVLEVEIKSRKFIVNQNKKITDEILFEIQDTANEALDGFRLHTRAKEQPMLDVFQHPIIAEFEEKQEVHLTGNDEADTVCSFCCIL